MWFIDAKELLAIGIACYIASFLIILPSTYGIRDLESGVAGAEVGRKLVVAAAACFVVLVLSIGIFSKLNSEKLRAAEQKGYTTFLKGTEVMAESVSPKEIALKKITVDNRLKTIEVDPLID